MKRGSITHYIPIGIFISDVVSCFLIVADPFLELAVTLRELAAAFLRFAAALRELAVAFLRFAVALRQFAVALRQFTNAFADIAVTLLCLAARLLAKNALQ